MFKKIINSNNSEIIKTGGLEHQTQYPVGKKFLYDGQVWSVRESFVESNEDWRRVISSSGNEEVMTLKTLLKDAELMHDVD